MLARVHGDMIFGGTSNTARHVDKQAEESKVHLPTYCFLWGVERSKEECGGERSGEEWREEWRGVK